MIAATYGPVEDIEILWTLVAFVGVIYSLINVREARADWEFVKERKIANGRRVLARVHLISETLRLASLSIFLTIGVLAATIESPPPEHHPSRIIVTQFLVRWGLIAASIMLVVKSYLAKRVRDELKVGGHTRLSDQGNNERESTS